MLSRRFHPLGLFAVLLALMVQLGVGATVPRPDPFALLTGAGTLCHADDESGTAPSQAPGHPADCLVCPLCVALHAQAAPLIAGGPSLVAPSLRTERRAELPPPSTAPPATQRPPSQPRAPPITS
nr:DUF2946 family protein [uncultured Rhodopila sp.]